MRKHAKVWEVMWKYEKGWESMTNEKVWDGMRRYDEMVWDGMRKYDKVWKSLRKSKKV